MLYSGQTLAEGTPRSARSRRSGQVTTRTRTSYSVLDRVRRDARRAVDRAVVGEDDRAVEVAAGRVLLAGRQLVVAPGGGGVGDPGTKAERAGDDQGSKHGPTGGRLEHLRAPLGVVSRGRRG